MIHIKWLFLTTFVSCVSLDFSQVQSADVDLSALGRVVIGGNFAGVSLFDFPQQVKNIASSSSFSANSSDSIYLELPNGVYYPFVQSDGNITSMCALKDSAGSTTSIVFSGNFSTVNGTSMLNIGFLNTTNDSLTLAPMDGGIDGSVSSLLCLSQNNTVVVGGLFNKNMAQNAIKWVAGVGWQAFEFGGFNGKISSIASTNNNSLLFGGQFDSVGNSSIGATGSNSQIINLQTANITAGGSARGSDPRNIACTSSSAAWNMSGSTGSWSADLGFGFRPTKLRLRNSQSRGHGVKTFRFIAQPIGGILNMTYIDSAGQQKACDATCPLQEENNFQEFTFVNVIGMGGLTIAVSDSYGGVGGLSGIELYQNDIFAYAIGSFNEPTCNTPSTRSISKTSGSWTRINESDSAYLSANLSGNALSNSTVTFQPNLQQNGIYVVLLFTPGCMADHSCSQRGGVNATMNYAEGQFSQYPLWQTNNFDKYDMIYNGPITMNNGFRPSVSLSAAVGDTGTINIVAQKVQFILTSSSGGVNGLWQYNPGKFSIQSVTTNSSIYQSVGLGFASSATVSTLVNTTAGLLVAGNFTSQVPQAANVLMIGPKTHSISGNGLNGLVTQAVDVNGTVYFAGDFTNTQMKNATGLSRIAAYDVAADRWSPMGGGLNGEVSSMVPIFLNFSGVPHQALAITGNFTQILASSTNAAASVADGFALWVPDFQQFLSNLSLTSAYLSGKISGGFNDDTLSILCGTISSQAIAAGSGAVSLTTINGQLTAQPYNLTTPSSSTSSYTKRDTSTQPSGVYAGAFYTNGSNTLTILGGHFVLQGSNGVVANNLAIVNGDHVSGLPNTLSSDSTFRFMHVHGDTLFAGGNVQGSANGGNVSALLTWSLSHNTFTSSQPPPISGGAQTVFAITTRPNSRDVFVGGDFVNAGSLDCPALCVFDDGALQWVSPRFGITKGSVANVGWAGLNILVFGGSFTINNTVSYLTSWDFVANKMTFVGDNKLPGPVSAFAIEGNSIDYIYAAGTGLDGSTYVMRYNGQRWLNVTMSIMRGSTITALQLVAVTQNHAANQFMGSDRKLLAMGQITLQGNQNVSGAIFDGVSWQPFLLSTAKGSTGAAYLTLSAGMQTFPEPKSALAIGLVILVALAIALGIIFLLILIGLVIAYFRRRSEGYHLAPTTYNEKADMQHLPPQNLFSDVGKRTDANVAPKL